MGLNILLLWLIMSEKRDFSTIEVFKKQSKQQFIASIHLGIGTFICRSYLKTLTFSIAEASPSSDNQVPVEVGATKGDTMPEELCPSLPKEEDRGFWGR